MLIRELYFIVLDKLCTDHFHTALEIAQSGRRELLDDVMTPNPFSHSSLPPSLFSGPQVISHWSILSGGG